MDLKSEKIFETNKDALLAEAASRYGTKAESLKRLGSFESMVFEYDDGGAGRILKVTHSIHRTPEMVRGELDWTKHLIENGVSVSKVLPSVRGEMLEIVNGNSIEALEDDYFLVYVLEKAPGKRTDHNDWSDDLVRKWGQITGRMHSLAKDYKPADPSWKRNEWHEDDTLKVERHVPQSQPIVIDKCNKLIEHMRTWPTDRDSYGLIHSDVHHGNFVIDNGAITIFDFDDCHYSWFGFDIMIPLFYVLRDHKVNPDDVEFARRFLGNFLEGYNRENSVDGIWIKRIPEFMKLREIDLYSILHAENAAGINDWCRRFVENRQSRIENDIPVIDMDFSEFA